MFHGCSCSIDRGCATGRVDLRKDAEHRENESCQNEDQRDQCPSALDDIGSTHVERRVCTAETVAGKYEAFWSQELNVER